MLIHTGREINAYRPDVVIKNKRERRCKIVDVALPTENNTSVKVAEKLSTYKDLEIEISKMWHIKTDSTSCDDRSFRTCEKRTGKIHKQYSRQHQHLRNPEECPYVAESTVD